MTPASISHIFSRKKCLKYRYLNILNIRSFVNRDPGLYSRAGFYQKFYGQLAILIWSTPGARLTKKSPKSGPMCDIIRHTVLYYIFFGYVVIVYIQFFGCYKAYFLIYLFSYEWRHIVFLTLVDSFITFVQMKLRTRDLKNAIPCRF